MSLSAALLPTNHVRSVVIRRSRPAPMLKLVVDEPAPRVRSTAPVEWWERRAEIRRTVGGCPDHWWSPTARTTAACTCDRFA